MKSVLLASMGVRRWRREEWGMDSGACGRVSEKRGKLETVSKNADILETSLPRRGIGGNFAAVI